MGNACGCGTAEINNNKAKKIYRVDTINLHVQSKHEFKVNDVSQSLLEKNFDDLTTSKESIDNVYNIDSKPFSQGFFGEVSKAKLRNNPTKFFAIKTIDKEKVRKEMNLLAAEVEHQRTVDHPNIVKFYESYQDSDKFHIVLEYCSGNELFHKIREKDC